MENLKYIFIVYLPGYAGNFLLRLLSLTNETVPALPNILLEECDSIPLLSIEERLSIYSFSDIRNRYSSWQSFHRDWADFFSHKLISSKINNHFSYICFSLHLPEFFKFKPEIEVIKNKMIFFVDLDRQKYQTWLNKSKEDLHFKYRLDEIKNYYIWKNSTKNLFPIDLTKIIENEFGFIDEYLKVCNLIGISPNINAALNLYKEWYDTRVQCYL